MISLTVLLLLAVPPPADGAAAPNPAWPKEIVCAPGTTPTSSRGRPPPPPGASPTDTPPEVTQFVCKDAAGKRQGAFLARSDAGVTLAKGAFVDDKPDGKWTFSAPDGSKMAELEVKDGVPSGNVLLYYPSGKLRGRTKPSPDAKTLVNETFYESGAKASVHVIDRRDGSGKYTGWHENGTKAADGSTLGNVRQGVWHEFDDKGKLSVTADYDAKGDMKSCLGAGCPAKSEPRP
jgi:antitoxin component YwqK of YwqJK toxin-antitoxin module